MSDLFFEVQLDSKPLLTLRMDLPETLEFRGSLKRVQEAITYWAKTAGGLVTKSLRNQFAGVGELRSMREYCYADGAANRERVERHLNVLAQDHAIYPYNLESAPSDPEFLVGRSADIATIQNVFDRGASVYLAAPRRYGKSSLLRSLARCAETKKTRVVEVDLSDARTCRAAVIQMIVAAVRHKDIRETVDAAQFLPKLPGSDGLEDLAEWTHNAHAKLTTDNVAPVLKSLLTTLGTAPTEMYLDEFSQFLRHTYTDEKAQLMDVLASLSQARRDTKNLRMVICGSGGLLSFATFYGLNVLDDSIEKIELRGLGETDATELFQELLYGHRRWPNNDCSAAMLVALGPDPVPHFVHCLVRAIVSNTTENVTKTNVEEAYRHGLLGTRGNGTFREYALHKQAYPPELLKSIQRVLAAVAKGPDAGVPRESLVSCTAGLSDDVQRAALYACIEEDYDVRVDNGLVRFRCKPLRDRWRLREEWLVGDR